MQYMDFGLPNIMYSVAVQRIVVQCTYPLSVKASVARSANLLGSERCFPPFLSYDAR